MLFDEFFDFICVVIGGVVDEKNDAFDFVSPSMGDDVAEMFSKFDVSSSVETVPDDVFLGPEKGDEAVYSFVIAECWDEFCIAFFCPASCYF